jgi:hypothetical protein
MHRFALPPGVGSGIPEKVAACAGVSRFSDGFNLKNQYGKALVAIKLMMVGIAHGRF